MKKLFCFLSISVGILGLNASCLANLSDGFQVAEQRWGKPFTQGPVGKGLHAAYSSNGWLIEQYYNANGQAVAVKYYKLQAKNKPISFINKAEMNGIWLSNVVGEGQTHWAYLPESTANQQMWYSAELNITVHLELIQTGETWTPCLSFATADGVDLILEDLKHSVKPAAIDPTQVDKQQVRFPFGNEPVTQFSTREHPLV